MDKEIKIKNVIVLKVKIKRTSQLQYSLTLAGYTLINPGGRQAAKLWSLMVKLEISVDDLN